MNELFKQIVTGWNNSVKIAEGKKEETFVCEICHCKTPKQYEGTEPNTCEMCMPKGE